jgi:hypothetical protein
MEHITCNALSPAALMYTDAEAVALTLGLLAIRFRFLVDGGG